METKVGVYAGPILAEQCFRSVTGTCIVLDIIAQTGLPTLVLYDKGEGRPSCQSEREFREQYPYLVSKTNTRAPTSLNLLDGEADVVYPGRDYAGDGEACRVTSIIPSGDGLEPIIVLRFHDTEDTAELGFREFLQRFPNLIAAASVA